jgi:hypothetical protein
MQGDSSPESPAKLVSTQNTSFAHRQVKVERIMLKLKIYMLFVFAVAQADSVDNTWSTTHTDDMPLYQVNGLAFERGKIPTVGTCVQSCTG